MSAIANSNISTPNTYTFLQKSTDNYLQSENKLKPTILEEIVLEDITLDSLRSLKFGAYESYMIRTKSYPSMIFENETKLRRATRRLIWSDALSLEKDSDLKANLTNELARYLDCPISVAADVCAASKEILAQTWNEANPKTSDEIISFYQKIDTYLFELTRWHSLSDDESALVQVEAFELALAQGAKTALDFGSGIGSLGLLLAQHGIKVTLSEINSRLNDYAKWRFEQRGISAPDFIDLNTNQLPTNEFDFISALDVLEHSIDPGKILMMLGEALREGGLLFIHMPQQSDDYHPMHLWNGINVLASKIEQAGLLLEHATSSTLILRKGVEIQYVIQPEALLNNSPANNIVFLNYPLKALRLNSIGFELIEHLYEPISSTDLTTKAPNLSLVDVVNFINQLLTCGLLRKLSTHETAPPFISVIVPAHNRQIQTRKCVESLLALDYPSEKLEIIVVDDASDPPLDQFLSDLPMRLLRNNVKLGASATRNLAAMKAQGDLLAFIDNDCEANPNWLKSLIPFFNLASIGIVGGRVGSPKGKTALAKFEEIRTPLDLGPTEGDVGLGKKIPFIPACNFLIRKSVFLYLNGFEVGLHPGEDPDLVWRAARFGIHTYYSPTGYIIHHHRIKLGALLSRRAEYGASESDLQLRHSICRRVIRLPITWSLLLIAALSWSVFPSGSMIFTYASALSMVFNLYNRLKKSHKSRIHTPTSYLLGAWIREQFASLYHLSINITRYYGLVMFVVGIVYRPLLLALFIITLILAFTDYYRSINHRIQPPSFIIFYILELIAYQIGVIIGSLKNRSFLPFIPTLKLKE